MSHRFDWRSQAECAGHPTPDIFFPEGRGASAREAKTICQRCPVQEWCLRDAAMVAKATGVDLGVRGSLTADERRQLEQTYRRPMAGNAMRGGT